MIRVDDQIDIHPPQMGPQRQRQDIPAITQQKNRQQLPPNTHRNIHNNPLNIQAQRTAHSRQRKELVNRAQNEQARQPEENIPQATLRVSQTYAPPVPTEENDYESPLYFCTQDISVHPT